MLALRLLWSLRPPQDSSAPFAELLRDISHALEPCFSSGVHFALLCSPQNPSRVCICYPSQSFCPLIHLMRLHSAPSPKDSCTLFNSLLSSLHPRDFFGLSGPFGISLIPVMMPLVLSEPFPKPSLCSGAVFLFSVL